MKNEALLHTVFFQHTSMTTKTAQSPKANQFPILLIIFGLLGIFLCICLCLISVGGLFTLSESSAEGLSADQPTPDARVNLSITDDGCHVERTDPEGSSQVSMLTWVITDLDGNVLLERNAEGEYKYGYYQSGTYLAYVKGWYEGRYHQLSNEVMFECP
jgi:hypothetical protein